MAHGPGGIPIGAPARPVGAMRRVGVDGYIGSTP